ncbi:hypothetical protein AB237_0812 [Acinetobacter baumannii NCGM 237]|nr:hypothetical protein AB237_0812 [Acinetobacter baumannii NCGM 237]
MCCIYAYKPHFTWYVVCITKECRFRRIEMTTKKFDATPTAGEPINLEEISKESVQEAWKDYEAKPEYKAFNKHDLIESMQHSEEEQNKSS